MELTNDFHLDLDAEAAWALLTDLERIAPCLPGATLDEVDGDEHRGRVKVKVGPITAQYKGVAKLVEADEPSGRAVIEANGKETRGAGTASAVITATLAAADGGTDVHLVTELKVTGKVAQFGRGVMADISAQLLDQMVACIDELGDQAPTDEPGPAAPTEEAAPAEDAEPAAAPPARTQQPAPTPRPRVVDDTPALDLGRVAAWPVARRVLPLLLAVVALVVLVRAVRSDDGS